jgi:hypothetical protein
MVAVQGSNPGQDVGAGASPAPPAAVPAPTPRNLNYVLMVTLAWKGEVPVKRHPSFTVYDIEPEPGWPVGRKGLLLASLWKNLSQSNSDGIFICDADVAIDQADMDAMINAVCHYPEVVHVAPVKLWPRATGLPAWVWGHRRPVTAPGATNQEIMAAWQEDIEDPTMFSFNFTYLPRRLIEGAVKSGLKDWIYPHVDENMSKLAQELGIPVRVVRNGCSPRHMHY